MDRTSPTHDTLVKMALEHRRDGNLVGLATLKAALRRTDSLRFDYEQAGTDQWWILDLWDGHGWIVETAPTGTAARTRANDLNRRNIGDGQRDLAAQLAAAVAS